MYPIPPRYLLILDDPNLSTHTHLQQADPHVVQAKRSYTLPEIDPGMAPSPDPVAVSDTSALKVFPWPALTASPLPEDPV